MLHLLFSVFTGHVIKLNRNHSINKFTNLGYDKCLLYKQSLQESGLCCFFIRPLFAEACHQYRALYGGAMFVPFEGHKHEVLDKTLTPGQLNPYKINGKMKIKKAQNSTGPDSSLSINLGYLKLSRRQTRCRFPTLPSH